MATNGRRHTYTMKCLAQQIGVSVRIRHKMADCKACNGGWAV